LSIQESTPRPQAHRRWLALSISLVLTAVTLYFVFRGIDREVFERLLARQDRGLLVVAAFFILLQIFFGAERWRAVLSALTHGDAPPALTVQAVFYASTFFNCLPLGTVGGDVARIWLARRFMLSVRQLVLSVLVDRILAVGALVGVAALTLPKVAQPLAPTIWFGSAVILLCGATAFLLLQPIEHILGRWQNLRFISVVLRTMQELRYIMQGGGLLGFLFAMLSAVCGVLVAFCIARSLNINVGPIAIAAVISIATLVAALPISFAGWGVREVSVVALLAMLGVDREPALAMSVEIGLLGMLMNLLGGVVWLVIRQQPEIALTQK